MFDLTGKRALVTGASGGIGREIAKALGKAGARVALSGTRVAALEETARDMPGEQVIIPANLSNLEDVDKLVPQAEAALGGIDILVNNAGITRDNLFMRMKDEEWDEVLAVNLTAAFHLTRAVLRGMMKAALGADRRNHFVDRRRPRAIRGRATMRPRKRGWWGCRKALACGSGERATSPSTAWLRGSSPRR